MITDDQLRDLHNRPLWVGHVPRRRVLAPTANDADLDRHEQAVLQLAYQSILPTSAIWRAGWETALDRLKQGESLVPTDPHAWARALWEMYVLGNPINPLRAGAWEAVVVCRQLWIEQASEAWK